MSEIVLSAGVRQNLLALQNTAQLMSVTQTRLATGKKVNTPLDNAVNYFTAAGLQSRARDLNALLDAMSNAIKTIEAANNGINTIVKTIQEMQSTLMQARQDASWQSTSFSLSSALSATAFEYISLEGGALAAPVQVAVNKTATPGSTTSGTIPATYTGGTLVINGTSVPIAADSTAAQIKTAIDGQNIPGLTVTVNAGNTITLTYQNGNVDFTGSTAGLLTSLGLSNSTNFATTPKTIDELVTEINSNASLSGAIRATNDAGTLRIQNISTADLLVGGMSASGGTTIDGTLTNKTTIIGNTVRKNLATQFNQLRDQLDKLSDDASFMGINLLQGDKLRVVFNELGTSTLDVQAKDSNGNLFVVNSANLGINTLLNSDLDSNVNIDSLLNGLTVALQMVRAQASDFGSSLSIVQNRQDFTKAMITTLETGADNLVLADTNEESANMLALQTRQQLSITALSLASQASQSVLRLFG